MSRLKRFRARVHVRQVRLKNKNTIYDNVLPPIIAADCSVLEANVKQTPRGDKYFIEEAVKKPKTENISQVILVSYEI